MEHVAAKPDVSERFACRALGQHRSAQREAPAAPDDEAALAAGIAALAKRFGRCGYRRIAALPRTGGWQVISEPHSKVKASHKRI